ncbi:hypothetical protein PANDA_011018 [Ailuropoda melanoleuca]|uniref:Uncharacterized protein n=1 Tax=Ailuropoda melanoleuca TaxID=9646 RepID=D2HII5_AILME|nr:hypothetical protein PANDA_011018 [Ailuropoda melanoleuca]
MPYLGGLEQSSEDQKSEVNRTSRYSLKKDSGIGSRSSQDEGGGGGGGGEGEEKEGGGREGGEGEGGGGEEGRRGRGRRRRRKRRRRRRRRKRGKGKSGEEKGEGLFQPFFHLARGAHGLCNKFSEHEHPAAHCMGYGCLSDLYLASSRFQVASFPDSRAGPTLVHRRLSTQGAAEPPRELRCSDCIVWNRQQTWLCVVPLFIGFIGRLSLMLLKWIVVGSVKEYVPTDLVDSKGMGQDPFFLSKPSSFPKAMETTTTTTSTASPATPSAGGAASSRTPNRISTRLTTITRAPTRFPGHRVPIRASPRSTTARNTAAPSTVLSTTVPFFSSSTPGSRPPVPGTPSTQAMPSWPTAAYATSSYLHDSTPSWTLSPFQDAATTSSSSSSSSSSTTTTPETSTSPKFRKYTPGLNYDLLLSFRFALLLSFPLRRLSSSTLHPSPHSRFGALNELNWPQGRKKVLFPGATQHLLGLNADIAWHSKGSGRQLVPCLRSSHGRGPVDHATCEAPSSCPMPSDRLSAPELCRDRLVSEQLVTFQNDEERFMPFRQLGGPGAVVVHLFGVGEGEACKIRFLFETHNNFFAMLLPRLERRLGFQGRVVCAAVHLGPVTAAVSSCHEATAVAANKCHGNPVSSGGGGSVEQALICKQSGYLEVLFLGPQT